MSYDKFSNGVSKMNLFSRLRSRPVHERRILAVSAYAAIAAVILALWIVSFRDNLARIGELPGNAPLPDAPALPSLLSPFATISQTWRQAREQLTDVLAGREPAKLGKTKDAPPIFAAPDAEGITVRFLTEGGAASPGAPALALPASAPPAPANAPARPESVAPILADSLATADTFERETAPEAENSLGRGSARPGFFSALGSVLSAIVHSFAGLTR